MTIATTKPVCADPAKGEFSNDGNYAMMVDGRQAELFVPRLKERHWRRAQIPNGETLSLLAYLFLQWFRAAEISRYSRERR